uniref:Phage tail collar domain-containing protein n=1 Tax=Chromera velia CCMP2878 TaxID=1169474 RepID=A0A0G4F3K1_9ALVE|eukprot:Cvel_14998.t1-p1 / transcript=Cvel_14998.t1 / gene=Cvel_14998 / organism=Chromera_velia_CCMP2878 / gene_product=hypothetical protein / transcript_product=hypothetical protein / location=Cvel_scaffold1091:28547-30447(+) / protein_length=535 / sequence_SO=supercontig / SO=protein_coding / is_pseudo=false
MRLLSLFVPIATVLIGSCASVQEAALVVETPNCFFLDFSCISGKIAEKGEQLIDHAKEAFLQAMDEIFDKQIKPLVYDLKAAIDRAEDKLDEIVQKAIASFAEKVTHIIDVAADRAEHLVDHTIEEIKSEILTYTFDRLEELEDKTMHGIMGLLDEVARILQKASCYEQAIIERIEQDLKKNLSPWPVPWDHCRIQISKMFPGHDLQWKPLSAYGNDELYELRKCKVMQHMQETTPVRSVALALREWEELACNMRCLCASIGAVTSEKHYIKEMGHVQQLLEALPPVLDSEASPPSPSPEAEEQTDHDTQTAPLSSMEGHLRKALPPPRHDDRAPPSPDEDCGTPVECYLQAKHMADDARRLYMDAVAQFADKNATTQEIADLKKAQSDLAQETKNKTAEALAKVETAAPGGSISVSPFFAKKCPPGWLPADGTEGRPDLRGVFIRGLMDFGTGVRGDQLGDPDIFRALGSHQIDGLAAHTHTYEVGNAVQGHSAKTVGGEFWSPYGAFPTRSTSSVGIEETRPRNVAMIFCVRA